MAEVSGWKEPTSRQAEKTEFAYRMRAEPLGALIYIYILCIDSIDIVDISTIFVCTLHEYGKHKYSNICISGSMYFRKKSTTILSTRPSDSHRHSGAVGATLGPSNPSQDHTQWRPKPWKSLDCWVEA